MSKSPQKATVEDASSPSLAPTDSSTETRKQDASGSEEEWDPSEDRLPGDTEETEDKGKGKMPEGEEPEERGRKDQSVWQAVWAAEQNAYYFWNTKTEEVTWTNPLQQQPTDQPPLPNEPPPLPSGPAPIPQDNHPEFGQLPDIDPALAWLLPPSQRGGTVAGSDASLAQRAAFNSRTGRFTPADFAYTVDHLDEFNRAKRMNSHYFDVDAWEKEKDEEHAKRKREEEMGGGLKKKITKKDMDRFRKKAAEKKARSQAWLRE
nr:hypothetical protein L204_04533 [Cryptococcus depauperatus CBS 7855]